MTRYVTICYSTGFYGFSDFVRGLHQIIKLSKVNNFEVFVNLGEPFSEFLTILKPRDIPSGEILDIRSRDSDSYRSFEKTITSEDNFDIAIRFSLYPDNWSDVNVTNYIIPSPSLEARISELMKASKIEENKYTSLYYRAGDVHLRNDKNSVDYYRSHDLVTELSIAYGSCVGKNPHNPVVFHSDSKQLKVDVLKSLIPLHVGVPILRCISIEPHHVMDNDSSGIRDALAEFYIISRAKTVFIVRNIENKDHGSFAVTAAALGIRDRFIVMFEDDRLLSIYNLL